ncbi:MAG: hypothetical protein ACE15D_03770 [Candidatus Eisenbacteria bacterium]|nr:hypothetical protein [Candidatus Eisenbacteria bacterium]
MERIAVRQAGMEEIAGRQAGMEQIAGRQANMAGVAEPRGGCVRHCLYHPAFSSDLSSEGLDEDRSKGGDPSPGRGSG